MSFNSHNILIAGGTFSSSQVLNTQGVYTDQSGYRQATKRRKWTANILRKGDVIFKFGRPGDIVIPVMGPTGVGKSTFINSLIGKNVATVGHDFDSGTADIEHFIVDIPPESGSPHASRLVIVDTPGFDDIYISDAEILRRISSWLAHSYACHMTIGGVIYLEDISQTRLHPSSRRNVEIFRSLCGSEALSGVVLVTTKWGKNLHKEELEAALRREEQLRKTLWEDLIAAGASVRRFKDTAESAWKIAHEILYRAENTNNVGNLQIQGEVVDRLRRLPETEAGKFLRVKVKELRQIQWQAAKSQRKGNCEVPEEMGKKLEQLEKEVAALKVGRSRQFLVLFGFA